MDDVVAMEVLEGLDSLADVVSHLSLIEVLLFPQQVEQRPFPQLQDQVNTIVFLVKLVQLQAVFVLDEKLDL